MQRVFRANFYVCSHITFGGWIPDFPAVAGKSGQSLKSISNYFPDYSATAGKFGIHPRKFVRADSKGMNVMMGRRWSILETNYEKHGSQFRACSAIRGEPSPRACRVFMVACRSWLHLSPGLLAFRKVVQSYDRHIGSIAIPSRTDADMILVLVERAWNHVCI